MKELINSSSVDFKEYTDTLIDEMNAKEGQELFSIKNFKKAF